MFYHNLSKEKLECYIKIKTRKSKAKDFKVKKEGEEGSKGSLNFAKIIVMERILKMQTCDGNQDFVNAEKILIVLFRRPHSFAIE